MPTIFKYQDKYYQAMNLDKKLKRLKLNKSDIDIVFNQDGITKDELEDRYVQFIGGNKKERIPNSEYKEVWYRYVNPDNKYDTFLANVNQQVYEIYGKQYIRQDN